MALDPFLTIRWPADGRHNRNHPNTDVIAGPRTHQMLVMTVQPEQLH